MSGTTEDVLVSGDERGRETQVAAQPKKARGSSKARQAADVATLMVKVDALEETLHEVIARVDKVESDAETLETHTLERLDGLRSTVDSNLNAEVERAESMRRLEVKVMDAITAMQDQLNSLKTSLERQTPLVGGTSGAREVRLDLPKPKEFQGVRDAKEVENFLWQMERYSESLNLVDEATKVRTASLFLSDNAMLWWRRKHADMERGLCKVETWDDFKRELKKQFYPENVVYMARKRLRELKHKTTIQDYVRDFTTLTLQIPNLSDEESLFYFVDGLQNWAKHELQRRGVASVDEAIAIAESLTDYPRGEKGETSRPKSSEPNHGNGGGDKGKEFIKGGTGKPSRRDQPEDKKKTMSCFVCKGPHRMEKCPKLGNLSALVQGNEGPEEEEPTVRMGSLRVLNALKAKHEEPSSRSKGLMFVDVKLNGKPVKVMVDTGATHNFITPEEAKRVGLSVAQGRGWWKSVNTPAKPLEGVARGVELCMGTWKGTVDLSVTPMDDFNMVLGMDFLRKAKVVLMPGEDSLCFLEKGIGCTVPTTSNERDVGLPVTYLGALKVVDPEEKDRGNLPPMVKRSGNPIPPRLQEKLPPGREVERGTEHEVGMANAMGDALGQRVQATSSSRGKSARRRKKLSDGKKPGTKYRVGDKVMVKLPPHQSNGFRGLVRGPFKIVGRVGRSSYKLDLPSNSKAEPVFHVRMLRPFHEDRSDPGPAQ
ncbi:hypothetical protein QN277_021899 [Acacia crassicarpa]|uniref:Retrotransposon gag domain-containing protein n=1 Tax=Acacia crassicarpa TaxID=499986 RepID=A0AAE1JN12_9FABA|nr:hypothetical protein QN277_021899 [Acacia crassicarpa]